MKSRTKKYLQYEKIKKWLNKNFRNENFIKETTQMFYDSLLLGKSKCHIDSNGNIHRLNPDPELEYISTRSEAVSTLMAGIQTSILPLEEAMILYPNENWTYIIPNKI